MSSSDSLECIAASTKKGKEMKRKPIVGLFIVLMMSMFLTYAVPLPSLAQTDEELIAVGIVTYGLVHLYEGFYEWGFMPIPGITGSRSEDGSFSFTFKGVDPDGDGQFILDGTNKATVSKNKVNEILEMTIHDSTNMNVNKVYITASGSPDDDLVLTSMKINGKAFTQSQIEALLEYDEDF